MMAIDCEILMSPCMNSGTSCCGFSPAYSAVRRAAVEVRLISSCCRPLSASAMRTRNEQDDMGAPYRMSFDIKPEQRARQASRFQL